MDRFSELRRNFGVVKDRKDIEEGFINRVVAYCDELKSLDSVEYGKFFRKIAIVLGKNPYNYLSYHGLAAIYPNLTEMVPSTVFGMMEVLLAMRESATGDPDNVDRTIERLVKLSGPDLGISYVDGMFYPTGEGKLDTELLEYVLRILTDYPNEDKDLRNAINSYKAGSNSMAITQLYTTVEGVARKLTGKNGNLDKLRSELLTKYELSGEWGNILNAFMKFCHDHRHSNTDRHSTSTEETEGMMYLTCLLIRLFVTIDRSNREL